MTEKKDNISEELKKFRKSIIVVSVIVILILVLTIILTSFHNSNRSETGSGAKHLAADNKVSEEYLNNENSNESYYNDQSISENEATINAKEEESLDDKRGLETLDDGDNDLFAQNYMKRFTIIIV